MPIVIDVVKDHFQEYFVIFLNIRIEMSHGIHMFIKYLPLYKHFTPEMGNISF